MMVNAEISISYLEHLFGERITEQQLAETLAEIGMELEDYDAKADVLHVDITAERPDMVSAEGIARAVKAYAKKQVPSYAAQKSDFTVIIDKSVESIRPFTACAVVKGLAFDDATIKEIIWVQEKLHATFCRNRKKAAIGIYPLEKITMPITYKAMKPDQIRFTPLEETREMTGSEILQLHPTGQAYAHLLAGKPLYPVFVDAKGDYLSMPPIINSHAVGKVTERTKDIFIECSGFDFRTVSEVLNILVCMFSDMGGKVYEMELAYPDKKRTTPQLALEQRSITPAYVNKVLGTGFSAKDIATYLTKLGHVVGQTTDREISFGVQPYRVDIWHDIDIADDVARGHGFNNLVPELPELNTVGNLLFSNRMKLKISQTMVGMGFMELFTFALTDKQTQYASMQLPEQAHVALGYSADQGLNMVRTWLLPETLKALAANRSREFPQKVFEIAHVVVPDAKADVRSRTVLRMSCAISDSAADITKIRQPLDALFDILRLKMDILQQDHPSCIPGRCATIKSGGKAIGFFGELHPAVLERFNLIMPTVAFEIDFEQLLELLHA